MAEPQRRKDGHMLEGQKVVLRDKAVSDASNDYAWRIDPDLAHYDGVKPLKLSFAEFFLSYRDEIEVPYQNKHRFAIDTLDGKHIGNCMYYNVDRVVGEAELGIVIGDREYWNRGYGKEAISILVDHLFNMTQVERIYLTTLEWNRRAQRCFEQCGFVVCGHLLKKGDNYVIMELRRGWLSWQPASA
ncbi:GNAT family N-acetyltransferase [Chloroflexota bacterium]